MTVRIIIIGCGGFGREVYAIIEAINGQMGHQWTVEGFVDDAPSTSDLARVRQLRSRVLGSVNTLISQTDNFGAVIGIGSCVTRSLIVERLKESKVIYPPLVHPEASLGSTISLGPGVVIAAGARLSTNITIGAQVHIDQNVTVGHDAQIFEYARLSPQACISGSVVVGRRALIGANATILPGLRVGHDSVVGAGACVVKDVGDGVVVKGVPAK